MSKATESVACPVCGTELSMAQLFAQEDTERAFARLAHVSVPLGARVLQYITLFAPPKTRLTLAKQIKLVLQLLPDLERGAILHRGRDWAVPLPVWAQAIDQMIAARDAGRLELPMKNHGYLYAILTGLADKAEGTAEAKRETDRRSPPKVESMTVHGQPMSIGDALQTVYGNRDPALVKLDMAKRDAVPVPDSVRAHLAELRKKTIPR